jgi:hypothetical protein
MDRRIDALTAERISIALLTRAAFDADTARTFSELSGLPAPLVARVFARAPQAVRQHRSLFIKPPDRRQSPR